MLKFKMIELCPISIKIDMEMFVYENFMFLNPINFSMFALEPKLECTEQKMINRNF